ncbi:hypothetical protein TNCV_1875081 [Trichonephila clavipes]|nr:hypothetical protein TNCV_1875081 [Trichonephila clavipes]
MHGRTRLCWWTKTSSRRILNDYDWSDLRCVCPDLNHIEDIRDILGCSISGRRPTQMTIDELKCVSRVGSIATGVDKDLGKQYETQM